MQVIAIGDDSGIDLCTNCGGVFLDFFDGEPSTLARLLEDVPKPPNETRSLHLPCPDCRIAMELHTYLVDGPLLSRCLHCAGLFLSFEQRQAIARYHESETKSGPSQWISRLFKAIT